MTAEHDDWHFGTAGVLVVGTTAALLAVVAYPYGWYPAWHPAAAAAGCALAPLAAAWMRGRRRPADAREVHAVGVYRAALWLGFGAWVSLTNALGMGLLAFALLAAVVLLAAHLAPMFTPDPDPREVAQAAAGVGGMTTPEATRWKTLIDRHCSVGSPGVRIENVEHWDAGAGLTLTIEGPPGSGFTFQTVNDHITGLAASAQLPPGCVPIASEGAAHQGQAMLNIPLVNDTGARVYPPDYSPLTVNALIPDGFFPDGTVCGLEVRHGSVLIVGRKDGGKTTELHGITAGLARCVDALVWHVDMNNGGMSAPWLLPWLEGKCETPAVDWFAHEPAEALLMSRVMLGLAKRRKAIYARRAVQANSNSVPLDADVPEILMMIDEGAEVLGEDADIKETGQNITVIMRIGRAVGANVLMSVMRPIGDHLPVQVRKLCATRIGMRVEEKDEYDYLFPGSSKGAEPHMIREKGESFVLRAGFESTPRKKRSYNVLPDQIVDISAATQDLHPGIDEASLDFQVEDLDGNMVSAKKIYAERWDRCADYLRLLTGEATPAPAEPVTAAPPTNGQPDVDFEASIMRDLDALEVAEPVRPRAQVRTLSEGAELVVRIVTEPMMMGRILGEVDGAGKKVARQTVSEWVREAIAAERIEGTKKKGQYQPAGWTGPPEEG